MSLRVWCLILVSSLFVACSHEDHTVLHDTRGQQITTAQLKNQWVIINYWAPWCEACMEEVPELNRFYQHLQSSQQVVFYGVDYDHDPQDQLMEIVKQVHIDYPVLIDDPAAAYGLPSLNVVPTTFIINPQGKVVKMISGAVSEQMLLKLIQELKSPA
jgi:thiol-disulfide isomerase/thioredoxin